MTQEFNLTKNDMALVIVQATQSEVDEIDFSLTFTEEAMNDLNRVTQNAVRKAREHNNEIERLLGQLQALGMAG